jgi:hypothetical protein
MAGACLLGATLLAGDARATVIDFESLPACQSNWCDVGPTYSEDGFALAMVGTYTYPFVTFGPPDGRYAFSQTLYNNNPGAVTRLARDGGGLFSITSIDLAKDARPLYGFPPAPITFVGTFADATTVQQSFTITSGTLATFAFQSTFQGLVKLEWSQESPYHQFDNIVVTEAGPVGVPDSGPPLALVLGLWVAGAGFRRQRCTRGA